MTTIVNVKTRQQFDGLLHDLHTASILAVDTETEGLNLHNGDRLIGISFYFPDVNRAYYYGFGHGMGRLSDDIEEPNVRVTTTRYKRFNTQHLYDMFERDDVQADNAPIEWLDELRRVWEYPRTVVYFNAQFDLTSMALAGFTPPHKVYDARVGVTTLFSDWHSTRFKMPDGTYEQGSKELKWLAYYFDIEGAKEGIDALADNLTTLRQRLLAHDKHIMKFGNKGKIKADDKDDENGALIWILKASDVAYYAAYDTMLTYKLHELLLERLSAWDNVELYERMSETDYRAAWTMHMEGFKVDVSAAENVLARGNEHLDDLRKEACKIVGNDSFNIGSPLQVTKYLNAIGYPVKGSGKPVIEKYEDDVPLLKLVSEYRSLGIFLNTFIDKWYTGRSSDDRIHPSFGYNTKTGRWSSSNKFVGNLQNVPREVESPYSPKMIIRSTRNDMVFFEADYKNLELYISAWYCEHDLCADLGDTTLTDLLVNDTDMHAYTRDNAHIRELVLDDTVTIDAVAAYYERKGIHVEPEKIMEHFNYDTRYMAKRVNFACQYRGTGAAINRILNLPRHTADAIADGWNKAYPAISTAAERLEEMALTLRDMPNGSGKSRYLVYPLFGFTRKYNPYPTSYKMKSGKIVNLRKSAARDGLSTIVQGTAGLICTEAARRIALEVPEAVLHASVHDSIVFSLKPEHFDRLIVIRDIMTDYPVYPALKVDFEFSTGAWGEKRGIEDLEQFIREGVE